MDWDLAALVLSVAGASLGMGGTFVMAHSYHANGMFGFIMSMLGLPGIFFHAGWDGVKDFWKEQARGGGANREDRGRSIGGLVLIFSGFFFQVLGSICSYLASRGR